MNYEFLKNFLRIFLVYEYGDHGGILVAVKNQVPTTQLYYSLNEGKFSKKIQIKF